MRANSVNRMKSKSIRLLIDRHNVTNFEVLGNRRDIRHSKVINLFKVLQKGEHFETPIVINTVNDKDRIIDGNHRYEAILLYLNKYPNRKIEIDFKKYENLSEQEEKIEYTRWNLGSKQTTNDFVKQYWDDIPITSLLNSRSSPYPVSHVWTNNAIEFKQLVSVYLTKDDNPFVGGYGGSAQSFIDKVKALDNNDYLIIRAFLVDFINVYGIPNKSNMHYKAPVFYSVFRIWLDNYQRIPLPSLRNAMKRITMSAPVIYFQKMGATRENAMLCHQQLLQIINGSRTRNTLI